MTSTPGPKRLTRNWNELLQELRVVQTGVQILTGSLLTLPFTNRFAELDSSQRRLFLAVLCGSVLTTALVVAPVALHRALFRRRRRPWLIKAADVCARAGLFVLAVTSTGVIALVFDVTAGRGPAVVAAAVAATVFLGLWVCVPACSRGASDDETERPPEDEDDDGVDDDRQADHDDHHAEESSAS